MLGHPNDLLPLNLKLSKKLNIQVREREVSVEAMSAEWGVSRAEIVRRCGAVKSDQELEDERKLRQLEKFEERVQKAGFVKKESHLEKQIAQAEGRMDELSAYEKMRLENMKERQALLEQLDIDQEKKEIAEERQKSMIFAPKEEVEKRAPSARVKALKERRNSMQEEQMKLQLSGLNKCQWVSPKWVGQWLLGCFRRTLFPKKNKATPPRTPLGYI